MTSLDPHKILAAPHTVYISGNVKFVVWIYARSAKSNIFQHLLGKSWTAAPTWCVMLFSHPKIREMRKIVLAWPCLVVLVLLYDRGRTNSQTVRRCLGSEISQHHFFGLYIVQRYRRRWNSRDTQVQDQPVPRCETNAMPFQWDSQSNHCDSHQSHMVTWRFCERVWLENL